MQVVIPNPKTSGNGRYSYLAAWQFAKTNAASCKCDPMGFEKALFTNVPVLDTGGRGATTSFAQRGVGDVLLTFENEIYEIRKEFASEQFETVIPSVTVRANNPVAWVDSVTERNGTSALAQDYLKYHYSDAGQELFATHGIRPVDEAVLRRHAADFPALNLFDVESAFGSWSQAQAAHFADGASFDQIIGAVRSR
jgi:sulfate transport system substrate-binding protein